MVATAPTEPARGQRLPSLTSLRWFAAVAVFVRHGGELMAGSSIDGAYQAIARPGATGVSFFFILSGFVLAWAFRPDDSWRAFFRRRIARIGPAYWVMCAVAIVIIVVIDGERSPADIFKAVFPVTLLQSWFPMPGIYYGGNGVSWSLSDEAFFYAIFPLVIAPLVTLHMRVRTGLLVGLFLITLTIPLVLHPLEQNKTIGFWLVYIAPPTRVLEFLIGICLCLMLRGGIRLRTPLWLAVVLTVGAYVLAGQVPLYLMWVAVTLLPFSLLIFAFAEADLEGRARALHHPWLVRLGEWSYAFYLVHFLVIEQITQRMTLDDTATGYRLLLLAASFVLSVALAALLYHVVERPLERRLRHAPPRASEPQPV